MSSGADPRQRGAVLPAYFGLILIWSTTPLAVVIGVRDIDAIWSLTIRMTIGALLASAVLLVAGLRMVWDRAALKLYAIGSLSIFGAMLFTYLGARHLPSGMISVLFGLSPLVVGLLSGLFRTARVSALQWLGMILGVLGLTVIFLEGDTLASTHVSSVLLVLIGVLSYAVSALWIKQAPRHLPPLVQTAGALWISAIACVLILPVLGGPPPRYLPSTVTMAAIFYSASISSIVAMLFYFFLLQRIEVRTMSLITLVTPVFALLLGFFVNHERFRMETLWGMGLILLGLAAYYKRELQNLLVRLPLKESA